MATTSSRYNCDTVVFQEIKENGHSYCKGNTKNNKKQKSFKDDTEDINVST